MRAVGTADVDTTKAAVTQCTDDWAVLVSGGAGGRFVDNGDGTVSDTQTGLMWEKKTGTPDINAGSSCPGGPTCGDPHNVNNLYQWSVSGTEFDGGAQTLFLDVLNDVTGGGANCFAGHCDWRLPTSGGCCGIGPVQPAELESIVDCSGGSPCIDPVFGPTAGGPSWEAWYWSSSTLAEFTGQQAFDIDFGSGAVGGDGKVFWLSVRAVRGGL